MSNEFDANSAEPLRVLAICAYPIEAAATRFRVAQYIEPLRKRGIELTVKPFLETGQFAEFYRKGGVVRKAVSILRPLMNRIKGISELGTFNVLFVQREAMMFGPGVFEWLYSKLGRLPLVLDLDDATYVSYISPTYGRIGTLFKFVGKTDNLIRRASLVTCGNRFIAEYTNSKGTPAVVIPTVVDLDEFRPRQFKSERVDLTVGWIGTHSTFPFLESILPVLIELARKHKFRLKIVGSGKESWDIKAIDVDLLEWSLERETEDFRSLDIGLYPITTSSSASEDWIKGKSGFKAVQYMAVGVPFVMSPIGVCGEIGEPGYTHFNANTLEDWYNSLDTLLADGELRIEMGLAARKYAIENYDLMSQAEKIAEALKSVGREHRSRK
jgi:glycosyltransferase involved in cell wall biosynthesis